MKAQIKVRPDGRAVAIKNELSADGWSVMTVDNGGHNGGAAEVDGWLDHDLEVDVQADDESADPAQ